MDDPQASARISQIGSLAVAMSLGSATVLSYGTPYYNFNNQQVSKGYNSFALSPEPVIQSRAPGAIDMDREQIGDMISASEARADTKLEKAMGEFRLAVASLTTTIGELKGSAASKNTVIVTGVAVVGIIVAIVFGMMTVGQQWLGIGMQSHDLLLQAAKEGAQQALAMHH